MQFKSFSTVLIYLFVLFLQNEFANTNTDASQSSTQASIYSVTDQHIATKVMNETDDDDCPNGDLHLFDMYTDQDVPTQQYINKCNFTFLELSKHENTKEMLILASIFPQDNKTTPIKLKFLDQMPYSRNGYTYRVVIRFDDGYPNTTTLQLTIDNRKFMLNISENDHVLEYMLPELNCTNNPLPQLSVDSEQIQYINTSYMIVCLK